MTLRKVPGSRTYQAEDRGFQEIGLGAPLSLFMMNLGRELEGDASAVGESTYGSGLTTVRMGWLNEPRVAVEVYEVDRHWHDSRDEILLRIIERKAAANARR